MTEAAMTRYIKDERVPKLEILANIATALGTTTDYLITGTENPGGKYEDIHNLVARNAKTFSNEEKIELVRLILGK